MIQLKRVTTYDKSRLNSPTFLAKKNELLEGMDVLFDIFCDDASQRRKLEVKHQLLMTEHDLDFYNDQKSPRKRKCLEIVEALTGKDLNFQKRIKQKHSFSIERQHDTPG